MNKKSYSCIVTQLIVPRNLSKITNEHVKAYPDDEFIVRNSNLYCHAVKKSEHCRTAPIEYYNNSQKHTMVERKVSNSKIRTF